MVNMVLLIRIFYISPEKLKLYHNVFHVLIFQDCEEMIVKSKDLLQALKQYNKTEHSNIQQVMFETPPSTPVATSGNKNTSIKCEISKKLLL